MQRLSLLLEGVTASDLQVPAIERRKKTAATWADRGANFGSEHHSSAAPLARTQSHGLSSLQSMLGNEVRPSAQED